MIAFACDFCARKYRVDDALAGRKVKCKDCGTDLVVPPGKAAAPPRPPAVDLYDLEEGEETGGALPPPPRASASSPGRSMPKGEARSGGSGDSASVRIGRTLVILGLLSFVLPLLGLQVKGLHLLSPAAQASGGFLMVVVGAFLLLTSRSGVAKGLAIVVGGGVGLIVLLTVFALIMRVFRGPAAGPGAVPGARIEAEAPAPEDPDLAPGPVPGMDGPHRGQVAPSPTDLGRVVITGGTASPGRGAGGISLAIPYRVESPGIGVLRHDVMVKSSQGTTRLVAPMRLDGVGTLDLAVPGVTQDDGPFEVHFEAEAFGPGGRAHGEVSNAMVMTWSDTPAPDNPFGPRPAIPIGGNPFGPRPAGPEGSRPFGPPSMRGPGPGGGRPPGMPQRPFGPRFGPGGPR